MSRVGEELNGVDPISGEEKEEGIQLNGGGKNRFLGLQHQ